MEPRVAVLAEQRFDLWEALFLKWAEVWISARQKAREAFDAEAWKFQAEVRKG